MLVKTFSFSNQFPLEYKALDIPKRDIALAIRQSTSDKNLSLRKLAEQIESMSYPQLQRVTRQKNYTIETLLKVLYALDLELHIRPKK